MNQLPGTMRIFLAVGVMIGGMGGGYAYPQKATQGLPKGLEPAVKQFAHSYILGTGESHFVTSVHAVDKNNAIAMVGAISENGRDPNAYTVYAKRINGAWKIVRYEFVKPTGKKESLDQIPPFPYTNWQKDAP